MFSRFAQRALAITLAGLVLTASLSWLNACPFCSALNLTFAEQIKSKDIVVIAKLVEIAKPIDDPDAELPRSVFEITDVIKGDNLVRAGMKIHSLLIGRYPVGDQFLIMGVDPPAVAWSTPMKASPRVVNYLRTIQTLPASGPKRLAFFQKYFEDEESVLAFDAYDEFAGAPYEDVLALKDQMDREQLLRWIKNPKTSVNRRRLYLTMLGVCGTDEDIPLLEEYIKSGDRKKQGGLDALIACYLKLKGEDGLDLVVDTFLKPDDVEYVDRLATMGALRFHADDIDLIPRDRIVEAVRTLLDRPQIADMVIPDLARWEDWSCMERLVQMFREADADTSWIRVPIATYLRACPKPEAKEYLAELEKIDPDAIKRADFFLDFEDDWDEDGGGSVAEDETDPESRQTPKAADGQRENTDSGEDVIVPKDDKIDDQKPDRENQDDAMSHVARRVPLVESDLRVSAPVERPLAGETEPARLKVTVGMDAATANANESTAVADASPALSPIAATATAAVPRWQLIVIPFVLSVAIFLLLLSVLSGWFDRLIF